MEVPGSTLVRTAKSTIAAHELLSNLTLRELRGKYNRSVLGWAWSLVNPLATMGIYTVIFNVLLKVNPEPGDPSGLHIFAFFLLPALLTWTFFSNCVTGAMGMVLANANLVKKVWFPRELLVFANVASWVVSLGIELGVMSVALLIAGNMVLPFLPVVLVFIALLAIFACGLGLVLSVLNVYFRDVQHLVGIGMQLWFYATPIVYSQSLVDKHGSTVSTLYGLNPMVRFVHVFRNLFYDLRLPTLTDTLGCVIAAAASLLFGLWVFRKFEPRLAEEL